MLASWRFGIVSITVGYFVACAPVKFDGISEPSCGGGGVVCATKCTGSSCVNSFSVTKTIGQIPVDILLVNDNSGSMSPLQSRLGSAFSGFLAQLESAGLDYRIAMTTTDISPAHSQMEGHEPISANNGPSNFNGQGALQDGNLIDFGNGAKYLSSADANRNTLFAQTVRRPETVHCENSGYNECPSNDERGVFALNLVLDRTINSFTRPSSAFAVIILANEDERGMSDLNSSTTTSDVLLKTLYPQKNYDRPQTFVDKFRSQFPGKTLAVHSIIIKPGDAACLANQSPTPNIIGKYGYVYEKLSSLTGGEVGSICDANYTGSLQAIGNNIQQQALSLPFSCRPDGDRYEVVMNPVPSTPVTWVPNWTAMELSTAQTLPLGTSVTLTYSCTKAN